MKLSIRATFCLILGCSTLAVAQTELPFSPARWAGDLLFVSGQVGNRPGQMTVVEGGIQAETRQALRNVEAILADHGADLGDVVKCTVMLRDIAEWGAMNEVYVTFFPPPRPARSALGASGLAIGARVEIECIAYAPRVAARDLGPAGLDDGSFTAEVSGRTIHYEVHGEGPPVMVVSNSWGLDVAGLRGLLGGLERVATMIYFDPRGMGSSGPAPADEDLSMAAVREDFLALREHLGLPRVHALGWSNGATNLVFLAHEHPETLASAIYVHGAPRFGPADMEALSARHPELFRRFGEAQQRLVSGELAEDEQDRVLTELYLDVWFPEMLAHPDRSRDAMREAFVRSELSWRHARYSQMEGQGGIDQTALLREIPVPGLVIVGAHDALPPERGRELAEGLPRARYLLFEDSGHFAPLEEPHRFLDAVASFLGTRE
jgi:reactive intermediate/imine deaminase